MQPTPRPTQIDKGPIGKPAAAAAAVDVSDDSDDSDNEQIMTAAAVKAGRRAGGAGPEAVAQTAVAQKAVAPSPGGKSAAADTDYGDDEDFEEDFEEEELSN